MQVLWVREVGRLRSTQARGESRSLLWEKLSTPVLWRLWRVS